MFFVGQKVICINDRGWPHRSRLGYTPTLPRKGSIYTVRAIAPRVAHGYDEDGLLLEEIVNPVLVIESPEGARESELAFRMSRFRPLRATNIDVFLKMLESVPAQRRLRESDEEQQANPTDAPVRIYLSLPPVPADLGGWRTEPADTPPERPGRPHRRLCWLLRLRDAASALARFGTN